jgi:alpha-mannosidase
MIDEIHLLHHSHTDLGYTDLPSTCLDLHVGYIRQALDAAEASAGLPEAARFRWTCEVLAPVAELLRRHPAERARLLRLIAAGQVEVAGMPWNFSALLGADEWQAVLAQSAPLWRELGVSSIMQTDVNGLSWGVILGLARAGIRRLVMGINVYAGGRPLPPHSAFQWEGPDGSRIEVWLSSGYGEAFGWFHEREWRRGPVPRSHDPWYNPPVVGDCWDASPAGLAAAHALLTRRLAQGDLAAYPHRVLAGQVTNQWRMDNDPPNPAMAPFVAAWNAAGLAPRLVLSTPARCSAALAASGAVLPVVRGDWTDWWADALPAMGPEVAIAERAKARTARLPALATALGAAVPDCTGLWERAWSWSEHTFGSYESVPCPWRTTTRGQEHQLMAEAHRLEEDALRSEGALLSTAAGWAPSAHAAALEVLDPAGLGGGWVTVPGQALRRPATGLLDPASGERFPFEDERDAEWVPCDAGAPRPPVPRDDIWGFPVVARRAWVPVSGGRRRLVLDDRPQAPLAASAASGEAAGWRWRWDARRGALASVQRGGRELVDAAAPWDLGAVVVRQVDGWAPWAALDARAGLQDRWRESAPPALDAHLLPSAYGFHAAWRREHPAWRDCRQELRLLPDGALALRTRIWLREELGPLGLWLALPLAGAGALSYDGLGHPTRVGADQMPGCCGEHVAAGRWLALDDGAQRVTLDTTDTPVVSLGGIHARSGRRAGVPDRPWLLPCLSSSWWFTNFPHTRSQLIDTRHVLRVLPAGATPPSDGNLDLPCRPVG